MKTKILLFFALAACAAVSAQIRVNPGFRAGFSSSAVTDISGTDRTSFYVGADVKVRFSKWFALQPEINYSRQGMKAQYFYNYDPTIPSRKVNWNLDYIGITMSNKFYVFRGLNLQLSPYIDFLVNNRNIEPRHDIDAGANLGIGYDFANGIGVEMRLRIGGTTVMANGGDDRYDHSNAAFQIGATYSFNLKKK